MKRKPPQAGSKNEGLLTRAFSVVPKSLDDAARTVDVTFSTGAEVERRDFWTGDKWVESLSLDPAHVRLQRLNSGAPVLDSHYNGTRNVLGVVEAARIEDGKGVATLRFSKRTDVEPLWQDIRDGILRSVSVGYAVRSWKLQRGEDGKVERRTAVDWEPFEVSVVPIGADAGAQVRPHDVSQFEESETAMKDDETAGEGLRAQPPVIPAPVVQPTDEQARLQERARVKSIDDLCRIHAVAHEKRSAWLSSDVTVDAVRAAILTDIAERQQATHVTPGDGRREMSMVRDATNALLARAGLKVEGEGHLNFAGGSLQRMAERVLSVGGVNTHTLNSSDLATRALATSDFSSILNAVGAKIARSGYEATPLVHREIFRRASASDFKSRNLPLISAGQVLEEVPESGRIPTRNAKSEMASYALKSYAGIIPITRQLIINDDFDFLARVSAQRGRAAAETERAVMWNFVGGNPNAPDGTAVFHADHDNTTTAGSGAGVTAATLNAARQALREQLSPDAIAVNGVLRHIVCGTAIESAWDQLLNGMYVPTSSASAMTPSMRSTKLHVEPLISGEDWYGFTDYLQVDTFEYCYLVGNDGPRLEQRIGFEVDGIELKVALDFGVGCIDHRGSYWLNGA